LTCYVWFLRFVHNYRMSVYLSAAKPPNESSSPAAAGDEVERKGGDHD
jgi:hypothetical protein